MQKFSVLMSVYYKENPQHFDLALESNLIKQTLKPDEFILICDGKLTPELDFIIMKYLLKFPDVLRVYRKENGGLGKALNFGLLKCSNALIARSDSDDICVENRFEKQLNFFNEHPDISIISSNVDGFISDWNQPTEIKKMPVVHEQMMRMAKSRNPINHMAAMFRKDIILKAGSYRHVPYCEDYDLWMRAVLIGARLANIDEVLVHARVSGVLQRRGAVQAIKGRHILYSTMLKHGMINIFTYLKNMAGITLYVLMPLCFKEYVYNNLLRREK